MGGGAEDAWILPLGERVSIRGYLGKSRGATALPNKTCGAPGKYPDVPLAGSPACVLRSKHVAIEKGNTGTDRYRLGMPEILRSIG